MWLNSSIEPNRRDSAECVRWRSPARHGMRVGTSRGDLSEIAYGQRPIDMAQKMDGPRERVGGFRSHEDIGRDVFPGISRQPHDHDALGGERRSVDSSQRYVGAADRISTR